MRLVHVHQPGIFGVMEAGGDVNPSDGKDVLRWGGGGHFAPSATLLPLNQPPAFNREESCSGAAALN